MAITVVYYVITALFGAVLVQNFIKTRDVQKAVLYIIVLMPFVMRLFRLK
jgi:hypothetical protein